MGTQKAHITVCICTYKRPALLRRLLSILGRQETEQTFEYSIVVVDNDLIETARKYVEAYARSSNMHVEYYVECEQNIALARNKAILMSSGDYVAFIDDDELPEDRWLLTLFNAIQSHGCDGVLGPVLPRFEVNPPEWVVKGRFFDRPRHIKGHVLRWEETRTGNALLKRKLFVGRDGEWFNPMFGSGGEDRDLFRRLIGRKNVFIWCDDAPVFEMIPEKRWKRTILLKRALLRGKMALNSTESKGMSLMKSAVAVVAYSCSLPIVLVLGQHIFMKYLIKDCDHLGKIMAYLRVDLVREKYVGG